MPIAMKRSTPSYVLLEGFNAHAKTIQRYQKGKHVMAEPGFLDLRSDLEFGAGSREKVLARWGEGMQKSGVNIRYGAEVRKVTGNKHAFNLQLANGEIVQAAHVVLAIGLEGNPRKLGAPGEDLERCQYQLDDPKEFRDETILVVGAGDSAIENALALAEQNDVWIINRGKEFSRAKDANLNAVVAAIADPAAPSELLLRGQHQERRRGCARRAAAERRGADRDRRKDGRMPSHHRAARRDSAAQVRRVGRHQVSERPQRRHSGAVAPLREQRARRVRHRLARRLPADQAGDEPGLRRRRVHQRQRPEARRSPAARVPVPRPAVRAAGRRDGRALPDADPDVPADERACSFAS